MHVHWTGFSALVGVLQQDTDDSFIFINIYIFVKDGTVTFWSKTERGIKAETRLQNHPYDTESWGVLIREAQVLKIYSWSFNGHSRNIMQDSKCPQILLLV